MCPCNSYKCLTIDAQSCAGAVELPLVATVTGTHTIRVAFAGIWLSRSFDATTGQPFIVPNLFNFLYQHQMRIELPNGSLFNDTCYNVSAMATTWIDPLPYPPPTEGLKEVIIGVGGDYPALTDGREVTYTFSSGTTFIIPELIGYVPTGLRVDNLPYSPEEGQYTWDSTTGTLTFATPLDNCLIFLKPELFSTVPPTDDFLYFDPSSMDYLYFDPTSSDKLVLNNA